jgi:mRNA interferase MazF
LKRGSIVTVATASGFGQKPRPALVVQGTPYLGLSTVVLALISSDDDAARIDLNVRVEPTSANGLRVGSWVMVHSLASARQNEIGKVIGELALDDFARVDRALLTFLGLNFR